MNDNSAPGGGATNPHASLDISVKVYPVRNQTQQSNLLAFANVTLGGCFAVNDIRVMNGKNGPFMAMPSKKGTDGQFHDTCFPTTAKMRSDLNAAVMGEFNRVTQRESVRGAIQSGQREAAARPPAPFAERPRMPQAAR